MAQITIVLFFLAVGTLFVGIQILDAPRVTAAGVLILGATAVVAGLDVLRSGRAFFQPSGPQALRLRAESYRGAAARLWGLMFVVAGLLAIAGALAVIASPQQAYAAVDQFLDTTAGWGVLLAVLGAFLTVYGLIRVLGGGGVRVTDMGLRLRHWGYRVFGLACIVIGALLFTLGVVLVASPEAPAQWLRSMMPGIS